MNKRDFIKRLGWVGLSPVVGLPSIDYPNQHELPPLPLEEDQIWQLIRSQYELHPDFVNLESGYYNIIPKPTMERHLRHIKRVNLEGSYYMRNHRFEDKATITAKLGDYFGFRWRVGRI